MGGRAYAGDGLAAEVVLLPCTLPGRRPGYGELSQEFRATGRPMCMGRRQDGVIGEIEHAWLESLQITPFLWDQHANRLIFFKNDREACPS